MTDCIERWQYILINILPFKLKLSSLRTVTGSMHVMMSQASVEHLKISYAAAS
jgi:hypothetical protein